MNSHKFVKCAIVRGGTSKAIFILENDLPKDPVLREKVVLDIFGSPDVRQIDGLGGADLLTSKLAIVGPPTRPDADVDYTFGSVSLVAPVVDFKGTCGNISAAVGPFAINNSLVPAVEPYTTVRINLKNLDRIMVAKVPVKDGKALSEGDFAIDGVPGTGAKISLDWSQVIGGKTGKLLPTGNAKDVINCNGKTYTISIVDAGSMMVFANAEDFSMQGIETPMAIDADKKLAGDIELVRGYACQMIGLIDDWKTSRETTPYQPFFMIVSPPQNCKSLNGEDIKKENIDFTGRLLSMQLTSKAMAISGTACTGAAIRIPGSVAWDILSEEARNRKTVYIGHPSGRIPVESSATIGSDGQVKVDMINVFRTARVIMEGQVFLKSTF
jgi:2-methylaconitate cis-trans-isomerase PrpF